MEHGVDDRELAEPGPPDRSLDESMMAQALDLAREAKNLGEVPVGALVARSGSDSLAGLQPARDIERSDRPRRAAGAGLGRSIPRNLAP